MAQKVKGKGRSSADRSELIEKTNEVEKRDVEDYIERDISSDITSYLDTDSGPSDGFERIHQTLITGIDASPIVILLTDTDWITRYANAAYERMTGYQNSAVVGFRPRLFCEKTFEETFDEAVLSRVTAGEHWNGRCSGHRANKTSLEVDVAITPVRDASGDITNYLLSIKDITDDVARDTAFLRAQKMEAISTLADGLAHDFNNIFFAILASAQLAIPHASVDITRNNLESIVEAAHRATRLIKQLMTFGRKRIEEHTSLMLQEAVQDGIELLRTLKPANVLLKSSIDARCPAVLGNRTQIQQLLINLSMNAFHTMRENGGELEVTLEKVTCDDDLAAALGDTATEQCARISIRDSGCGMSAKTLSRVFEPYFTTIETDPNATGLGMATVHGIVSQHGGTIRVESEPGTGTLFEVFLPILGAKPIAETRSVPPSLTRPELEQIRVLFVDDEEILSEIGKRILTHFGYLVDAFTDSNEALAVFRSDPEAYDVVVTDQTMPGLCGFEFSRELIKLRPDVPIILLTGFDPESDAEQATKIGIREYVTKPITMQALAQIIERVSK
ncbi:MAG: response regulator [Myxococcota bacterium]|nr:response regulator [Myxococcota bacterium]